jgi:tetratricopeptide (TPR) repeat protein
VRGSAWFNLGKYGRALHDFDRKVALEPDRASNYYDKGNSLFMSAQYRQALADYSKAIELEDKEPDYYFNRALTNSTLT